MSWTSGFIYTRQAKPSLQRQRRFRLDTLEDRLAPANFDFPGQTYNVGGAPRGATLGDWDTDGDLDLVVANGNNFATISVLQNLGDGTFADRVDYGVSGNPEAVTTADINEDGYLDLISVNGTVTNSVSVLRNLGDGTFATSVNYPAGNNAIAVTLADVDNDGHLDIITANKFSDNVSVLRNLGTGTFAASSDYAVGNDPRSVAVADFDEDGAVDLIVANNSGNTVSVLRNLGTGTFAAQVTYGVGLGPTAVEATDVDEDGLIDVLTANYSSNTVSVLRNLGTGTFATQVPYSSGIAPLALTIADVDQDGHTDLMIGSDVGDAVAVLRKQANGTFVAPVLYEAGESPRFAVAADVDDDTFADLIATNTLGDTVTVVRNVGDGTFADRDTILATSIPNAVTHADVDGDGLNDLITASSNSKVAIYRNLGAGTFAPPVEYALGGVPNAVTVVDVDGDGFIDLVTANGNATASVLWNTGTGTFGAVVNFAVGLAPSSVVATDVDGDDVPDLVTANRNASGTVSVLRNQGDRTFATQVTYAVGSHPAAVVAVDVNGDGRRDIATAHFSSSTVAVLRNLGDGSFAAAVYYTLAGGSKGLAAADMDGDGHPDLASVSGNSKVSVLRNLGDGTFATRVDYTVGFNSNGITTADVDGDGRWDLVTVNDANNTVSVLRNLGDGTFAPRADFVVDANPRSVTATDFDDDGHVDLVTANDNSLTLSLLRNLGTGSIGGAFDLTVSAASVVPNVANVGEVVQLTWTVQNIGTQAAEGDWIDSVYLSSDNQWNLGDRLLTRFVHHGTVQPGEGYTQHAQVGLAYFVGFTPGNWHLVVRTDANARLTELNETNNVGAAPMTLGMQVESLTPDVPVANTLGVGQARYYRLDYNAHQAFAFLLQGLPTDGTVELYVRRNAFPLFSVANYMSLRPFAAEQYCVVPPQDTAGTLYVMVYARTLTSATTNFNLVAATNQLSVLTQDFGQGGTAGDFTLRAIGSGFDHSTTARLTNDSGFNLPAKANFVESNGEFYATFDLRGVTPGTYNVVFSNGPTTVTVSDSLVVVAATTTTTLIPYAIAPTAVRRGRPYSFTVEWHNTSLNDAPVSLVTVGNTVPFGTGPTDLTSLGTRHQFLGVNTNGGPAGFLRPGQRTSVTFWSYSDGNPGTHTVFVDRELKDPTAAYPWAALDSWLIPPGLTDAAFAPIFQQLIDRVGLTNGDFLALLRRNADRITPAYGDPSNWLALVALEVDDLLARRGAFVAGTLHAENTSVDVGGRELIIVNEVTGATHPTRTLADGSFIAGPLAEGTYRVDVVAGRVDPLEVRTFVINQGVPVTDFTLTLLAGTTLTGTVRNAAHAIVADAVVTIYVAGTKYQTTTTNSAGEFHFDELPTGPYALTVDATGYARGRQENLTTTTGFLTTEVQLTPGAHVLGTVVNDLGNAITAYTVVATLLGDGSGRQFNATVSTGGFLLAGLPAGSYELRFTSDGIVSKVLASVSVTVGQVLDVGGVVLQRGGMVSGQVIGYTGLDLSLASVAVRLVGSSTILATVEVTATGTFQLLQALAPGNYEFQVTNVVGIAAIVPVTLQAGSTLTNVQLTVQPGATLNGTLRDGSSQPIPYALIRLQTPQGALQTTETDAVGRYEFRNLNVGSYTVAPVLAASATTVNINNITGTTFTADLTVLDVAGITGTVYDAAGLPLAGASVRLLRSGVNLGSATTDQDGHYRFWLLDLPGAYEVQAAADDFTYAIQAATPSAGNTQTIDHHPGTAQLTLTLQAAGVHSGRVTLFGPNGQSITRESSDFGATVVFANLAPGTYTAAGELPPTLAGQLTFTLTAGSNNATLVFAPAALVSGQVVDSANEPVANAFVELISTSGPERYRTITDDEGHYGVAFVKLGTYTVAVVGAGVARTEQAGVVVNGDTVQNLTATTAVVWVAGQVRDGANNAVPNAWVALQTPDGRLLGTGTTDANGAYQIAAWPNTTVTVEAVANGYRVTTTNVATMASGTVVAPVLALPVGAIATNGDPAQQRPANRGPQSRLFNIFDSIFGAGKHVDHVEAAQILVPANNECENAVADYYDRAIRAFVKQNIAYEKSQADTQIYYGTKAEYYATWVQLTADTAKSVAQLLSPAATLLGEAHELSQFITGPKGRALLNQAESFAYDITRTLIDSFYAVEDAESPATAEAQVAAFYGSVNTYTSAVFGFLKAFIDDTALLLKLADNYATAALAGIEVINGSLGSIKQILVDLPKKIEELQRLIEDYDTLAQNMTNSYTAYENAVQMARFYVDRSNRRILQARLHPEDCDCDCEDDEHEDEGTTVPDDQKTIQRPASSDPNDIIGPAGYGVEQHIRAASLMPYTIRFENDPNQATAPASRVFITQTLDTDLDWTTFRLGTIGFGNTIVSVPDDSAFFQTRVDARATLGVYVDVTARIDMGTGVIRWELVAIDPATNDLPEDPFVGFLPPNANSPEGEGFVAYTVAPKKSAGTGVRIDAQASIVFDVNAPILTPPIFHTLDGGLPTSAVQPLPATVPTTFTVTWAGADDANGSGLARYNVYVSTNGGVFVPWLMDTTSTHADYTGFIGDSYSFYSTAIDNVGYRELANTPASTTVVPPPTTGNVKATVAKNGKLTIVGDALGNGLSVVAGPTADSLLLTGLGTTTINGQASVTLTGITNAVTFSLGNGDDVLLLGDDVPLSFANALTVALGAGANVLQVRNIAVAGNTTFSGGKQNDSIRVDTINVGGALKVSASAGVNAIRAEHLQVAERATITGGSTVTLSDVQAASLLQVTLSSGSNTLTANDVSVVGKAILRGGNSDDVLALQNVSFGSTVQLLLGAGANTLQMTNVTATGKATMKGGKATDAITITDSTFATDLLLTAAAGADTVAIFDSNFLGQTTLDGGTGGNLLDAGLPDGLANGNQFITGKLLVKKWA